MAYSDKVLDHYKIHDVCSLDNTYPKSAPAWSLRRLAATSLVMINAIDGIMKGEIQDYAAVRPLLNLTGLMAEGHDVYDS